MVKIKFKQAYILILCLISVSCTKTYKVKLSNPPQLPISANVNRIGVLNRSVPHEDIHTETKLDELLSLEGMELDEKGSLASVNKVRTLLENNSQFKEVKLLDLGKDSLLYVFELKPEPIPWDKIDEICKQNEVDVLVVLESYDTKSSFTQRSVPVTKQVPVVGPVTTNQFYVTVNTNIKAFWRVYDNKNRTDLFNVSYDENVITKADGISLLAAYNAVSGREQQVITKSKAIGTNLYSKTQPYSFWVTREYYHKGSSNLKVADKQVMTDSWDKASESWKKDFDHPKNKIKGRVYYNMALASEVEGDIEKAIEYATESYHLSGKSKALDYLRALKYIKSEGIERVK